MPEPSTRASELLPARQRRLSYILRNVIDSTWDQMETDPVERYAHIFKGSLAAPVHTTATTTPDMEPDEHWAFVGTIDLDTGDLIAEGEEKVLWWGKR